MKKDKAYQIGVIQSSKHFHEKWYQEQYPDVKVVGISAAEHFFKYGAALGRKPGKFFETDYYQKSYPDVRCSGLNPLVHYTLFGEKEGRLKSVKGGGVIKKQIYKLKRQLLSLGFTVKAVEDLKENLKSGGPLRAFSAKELALWSMRKKTSEGYIEAISYIEIAKEIQLNVADNSNLSVIEILAYYMLGDYNAAKQSYEEFKKLGVFDPDVMLAISNVFTSVDEKINCINNVLLSFGLSKVKYIPSFGNNVYDGLSRAGSLQDCDLTQPLVSVLIAAYNAEDTIQTTIRSLQEQTWKNIEILVLDDCSHDGTANTIREIQKLDSRVRLIQMEKNGGAYVARNKGLLEAKGELVTIHDADDWSHPQKLEIQCNYLIEQDDVIGCTSQQARADNNLGFLRWTGAGRFIITNTSSFMFKRKKVLETVGGWDTVRFSADNEFIRRIKKNWGKNSIVHLKTGPLSFQRDSDSSVVAHAFFGINGAHFGVRKEYLEAQEYHHNTTSSVYYNPLESVNPFPAPASMRGSTTLGETSERHFDVIIASDFRMPGGSVLSCVEEIKAQKKAGLKTGLIQLYRYDLNVDGHMLSQVREQVDGASVQVLTYGETVTCDVLIVRYPPVLQYYQEFIPKVTAKSINVIVNQPPMNEYSSSGVERYSIKECAINIKRFFGKAGVWYPIGPAVRDVLIKRHSDELDLIELSTSDWVNIIDVDKWSSDRSNYKVMANDIVLGRHARDNYVKWPGSKEDVFKAYPESAGIRVKILGGAECAKHLIGYIPNNWHVYNFGEVSPQDYLKELDFFIYYTHPDWIESFGRSILEALAAGVPVILPECYQPLFGDAATYATLENALNEVNRISIDPVLYKEISYKGIGYVRKNYSYETHIERISQLVLKNVNKGL